MVPNALPNRVELFKHGYRDTPVLKTGRINKKSQYKTAARRVLKLYIISVRYIIYKLQAITFGCSVHFLDLLRFSDYAFVRVGNVVIIFKTYLTCTVQTRLRGNYKFTVRKLEVRIKSSN